MNGFLLSGSRELDNRICHTEENLFRRILPDPVDKRVGAALKIGGVVLRQIAGRDGLAPFDAALVRLQLAHENFKERRLRQLVFADKGDLIILIDNERDFIQKLHAVDGLGHIRHEQNVLADLAFALKAHERVQFGRCLRG